MLAAFHLARLSHHLYGVLADNFCDAFIETALGQFQILIETDPGHNNE